MNFPKHTPPPLGSQPTSSQSEADTMAGVRFVNSPAGVLATRSEDVLRRYVLDAVDATDRGARQANLMREASITLSKLPSNPNTLILGHERPNFVEIGLFAWPVVVCMPRPLRIFNRLSLEGAYQASLAQALAETLVQTMEPGVCCARMDGFVNAQFLCGLSPLSIHQALRAEARGPASQPQATNPSVSEPNKLGYHAHQSPSSPVGPNLPLAFLMIGYLGWDLTKQQPSLKKSLALAKDRMLSLCNAFFTHKMVFPACTKMEDIELARPTVRVGEPDFLHQAAAQAQWMQLAWMAERARQGGFNYGFNIETLGSYLTMSATLTDDEDEVRSASRYSYDGFWQSGSQLALIDEKVSMATATGRMDCRELEHTKIH